MATETSSSAGATPSTGSPETGTPATQGVTPAKPALTIEEAQARIAELEKGFANKDEEAKRHFKNLSKYQEAEKAAQEAALSEVEKANKARADAEAKIQQYQKQLVNAQVRLAAKDKGIINPDIAAAAIADKLEYGDDGMPTNTDKALDELIKGNPYLVAKADAQPASPAQTNAPAIPVMSPGRSSIQSPGALPPNRPVRLTDPGVFTNR